MARNRAWYKRWRNRTEIAMMWDQLLLRYLDLYFETGDHLYWDAYEETVKASTRNWNIADRTWNRHHPECPF